MTFPGTRTLYAGLAALAAQRSQPSQPVSSGQVSSVLTRHRLRQGAVPAGSRTMTDPSTYRGKAVARPPSASTAAGAAVTTPLQTSNMYAAANQARDRARAASQTVLGRGRY